MSTLLRVKYVDATGRGEKEVRVEKRKAAKVNVSISTRSAIENVRCTFSHRFLAILQHRLFARSIASAASWRRDWTIVG